MSSCRRLFLGSFFLILLVLPVSSASAWNFEIIDFWNNGEIIAPDFTPLDTRHVIRVEDMKPNELYCLARLHRVQTWNTQVIPYAIDFDRNGNFYVSDIAGKMEKFSSTGQHLALFDLTAQVSTIRGLTIDRTGFFEDVIFLADETARQVHRYVITPSDPGVFWDGSDSVTPAGETAKLSPHGFAFHSSGNLLISDTANQLVFHCNHVLAGLDIIKPTGPGETGFNCPRQLAYDPDEDLIYIVDKFNARIVVMDMDGNVVRQWGQAGNTAGKFNIPHGLVLDKNRNLVYIGDTGNNRVQVFDTQGAFRSQWHSADFLEPRFMTIDAQGRVYVTSYKSKKVAVLEYH